MRFIDYVKGERLTLLSDLPPEEVALRLDAAIESMWTPFATGVMGWVALGRFTLSDRRYALRRRGWLPVLTGRIPCPGAGSRVTVCYRVHPLSCLSYLPGPVSFRPRFACAHRPSSDALAIVRRSRGRRVLGQMSIDGIRYEADENFPVLLTIVEEAAVRGD